MLTSHTSPRFLANLHIASGKKNKYIFTQNDIMSFNCMEVSSCPVALIYVMWQEKQSVLQVIKTSSRIQGKKRRGEKIHCGGVEFQQLLSEAAANKERITEAGRVRRKMLKAEIRFPQPRLSLWTPFTVRFLYISVSKCQTYSRWSQV